MRSVLVNRIDVWSVVRTVFPLGWVVWALLDLMFFFMAGNILSQFTRQFSEFGAVDMPAGVLVGILLSVFTAFFQTVITTIIFALATSVYNFLAGLGGGITITLNDRSGDNAAGQGSVANPGASSTEDVQKP